ncbi:MAG: polysaccharide deacetylase family protein [Opitutaceae bacterium]
MDSYLQTIRVTFRSEAAARRARLGIAPLYHDLRAAFSTRMDDTNAGSLGVAKVMANHGQKGTFYLNRLQVWWEDNAYTGAEMSGDPAGEFPPRLLAGGNSIGGHTTSHEYMPALSKNLAFREIMGIRVALEVQTRSPVLSFTYPYVSFRTEVRDGCDRTDLEAMLLRSGYYQLAEHQYNADRDSGLQDGVFVICDGDTDGGRYTEAALTQPRAEPERPLFLVTMHPWVHAWGGPEFPKLAEIYRKWSGRKDWWYCNQNQYAAYRYQARHAPLQASVEGNVLRAVLTRPDSLDLNDWTPLTLKVEGVTPGEVVSVACAGAEVQPVALEGAYAFDLFHDRQRGAIEVYAETDNPENSDQFEGTAAGAEGLRALLYRKGRVLTLALRNEGGRALEDLRVVFRLPLRWEDGVVRKHVGSLGAGAAVTLEVPLTERADAEHYTDGAEYNVAQVDFRGSRRVRLYVTCEVPGGEPPACFARHGFWVIGPLPGDMDEIDPQVFAKSFREGPPPERTYTVPWGRSLSWRHFPPAEVSFLDPDIIPTTGRSNTIDFFKWHSSRHFPHTPIHYILSGRIVSPENRTVRAVFFPQGVKRLWLNGQPVKGAELALKQGNNDLRILYAPPMGSESQFSERNYGCYFRLSDARGKRMKDLHFTRPPTP